MTGIDFIAAERQRQIDIGHTAGADDMQGDRLVLAAVCYAMPDKIRSARIWDTSVFSRIWPWRYGSWKPSTDNRVMELAKAGALIAAEIDRLQRLAEKSF